MMEVLQISPRQVMHLAALGQEERLAKANTIWMCASCNTCEVRCPRGIDIPKVMEVCASFTCARIRIMWNRMRFPRKFWKTFPQS